MPIKSKEEITNEILKSKLIEFSKQNKENLMKARKEIQELENEIDVTKSANIRLKEEIEKANVYLGSLIEEKKAIKRQKAKKEEIAALFSQRQLSLRVIKYIQTSLKYLKLIKAIAADREIKMKKKTMNILKHNSLISKVIKCRHEIINKTLQHKALNALHLNIKFKERLKKLEVLRKRDLMKRNFKAFKSYPLIKRQFKEMNEDAKLHYVNTLQLKVLRSFREYMENICLEINGEKSLSKGCKGYYLKRLIHKALISIQVWTLIKSKRKVSMNKAGKYSAVQRLRKALMGFSLLYSLRKRKQQKVIQYIISKRLKEMEKCFISLKLYTGEKQKINILKQLARSMYRRRVWLRWKEVWNEQIEQNNKEEVVKGYANLILRKKALKGLLFFSLKKEKERIVQKGITSKQLLSTKLKCMNLWIKKARGIIFYKKIASKHMNSAKLNLFKQWKQRYHKRRVKKLKNHVANSLKNKSLRKKYKGVIQEWLNLIIKKRREQNMKTRICKNNEVNAKRKVFSLWLCRAIHNFKEKIAKDLTIEAKELKLKNDEANKLISQLTEEYKDYEELLNKERGKRKELESQLVDMEAQLEKKEEEFVRAHERHKEIEEAINSYNNDIMQLKTKCDSVVNEYEIHKSDYEHAKFNLHKENEELYRLLEEAEKRLKNKHNELTVTERDLREVNTSREKQTTYFKQLERVNENNRKLTVELEEGKRNLAELHYKLSKAAEENKNLKHTLQRQLDTSNSNDTL